MDPPLLLLNHLRATDDKYPQASATLNAVFAAQTSGFSEAKQIFVTFKLIISFLYKGTEVPLVWSLTTLRPVDSAHLKHPGSFQ